MRQDGLDIKRFTSSTASYLLNAIGETIEFGMSEDDALIYIYDAFDKFAITMENKGLDVSDLDNDDKFVKKVAIELLLLINNDETTYEQMRNKYNSLLNDYVENNGKHFLEMSREGLENLGFAYWMDENPLMLIPVWAYRLIEEDAELTSISNDKRKVFSNKIGISHPKHVRYGHLAWGFYIKNNQEEQSNGKNI